MRIGTTQIDQFNKMLRGKCWRCGGYGEVTVQDVTTECTTCNGTGEAMSVEKFIEYVKSPEFQKNHVMELGTAFHEILEKPHECYERYVNQTGELGFISSDGIVFPFDVIKECTQAIDYRFPFEVKLTKTYEILGEPVTVVAKVDQLKGLYVMEHKSTWSGFDFNKYADSVQWKYYLELFEAERVYYKVFVMYEGAGGIQLKDVQQFHFGRYPDLLNDNKNLLHEIVDFVKTYELEPYLKDKEEYE